MLDRIMAAGTPGCPALAAPLKVLESSFTKLITSIEASFLKVF
jgi:hypothetical protein